MTRPRSLRTTTIPLIAIALALAAPASASAATRFVDDNGDDQAGANDCTTQATPCKTVAQGIGQAANGETVDVSAGSYAQAVALGGGKSLQHVNFAGGDSGNAVIDGGGSQALTVSSDAGTVQGFTLRSAAGAVKAQGQVTLKDDTFDSPAASAPAVQLLAGSGGSLVDGSAFRDPSPGDYQLGIQLQNVSSATTVSNNTFADFGTAILVQGSRPTISRNTITGAYSANGIPGVGIWVIQDAIPKILLDTISEPGAGTAIGIVVAEDTATVQDTGADIEGTKILDHSPGISVNDTTSTVYLFSDLIARAADAGLVMSDNAPSGTGEGDVTARNVTIWGGTPAADVAIRGATLTMDSSIVGAGGINRDGEAHCSIIFSRGPFSGQSECNHFFTTANPGFRDPGAGDFHLKFSSPLIDKGNPASPFVGATDFDGDPRALDGDHNCSAVRDVGADEFVPPGPCVPAPPYQTRVLRRKGRDFNFRLFGERGGNYTVCVRSPRQINHRRVLCRGGRLRQVGPERFSDTMRWGTNFRFQGPGHYKVSWYRPATKKLLGPRKTFETNVCPPKPQLMDGIWHPSPRLRVIQPCGTITGVATSGGGVTRHDNDLVVHFHTGHGHGIRHMELIPRDKGHTRGSGKSPHPGEALQMTGVIVCDGFHGPVGHFEMHPVFRIKYLNRRNNPVRISGPQYGGTPGVNLPFPGWHPCP